MSHLTLRYYGSTLRYLHRDPEQTTLLRTTAREEAHRVSVRHARHKIKSALREFVKGGLT